MSTLQSEKTILSLSANQIESVKAMNVALQEKVTELSKSSEERSGEVRSGEEWRGKEKRSREVTWNNC